MPSTPTGPLQGVRVLDLSSVVMGPLATQILGDLGADVITVEDPRGTLSRVMTAGPVPTLSGLALNLLRNKRNVVLDLKDPEGRRAGPRHRRHRRRGGHQPPARHARPARHDLRGRPGRPCDDVVYCQAQGYPSDSPAADAPAYDDVIQAGSGIPDTFRRMGGEPVLVPTLVADKVSGLTIAYAVLAALFERERTGRGQRIEVPMIDVMTAFTLVEHAGPATTVPPLGPPGYGRILNPERKPQRTADGWINVLAYTRQNYEDLFAEAGRPDLADDERIHSARSRIAHADSLYRDVAGVLTGRTTAEWLEFCAEQGHPGVRRAHPRGAGRRPPRGRPPAGRPLQGHPPTGPLRQPPRPHRPPPRRGQRRAHRRGAGRGGRRGDAGHRPPTRRTR